MNDDLRFEFRTLDSGGYQPARGIAAIGNEQQAHRHLSEYAARYGFDVHRHRGSWHGNAISTAYRRGGDPLFDVVAVVVVAR